METNFVNSLNRASKFWWVSLFVGLLSIAMGFVAITNPIDTLFALTIIFVISFLISGFLQIIYSIANKNAIDGWGWSLASGIIDVLLGILLLSIPGGNVAFFLLYIGFTVLFQSIWGLGLAIQLLNSKIAGASWAIGFAILGILFSFLLILNLPFTAAIITSIMAIAFLVYGIFRIVYAVKIKSIGKKMNEIANNKR